MITNTGSKKMLWAGRVMTALAALPFFFSAFMKFSRSPQLLEGWTPHFGWPESMITTIAILEVASVVLYLIPQVAVLGAIVLTGYLGGAISTHVRIGEGVVVHVIIGILIWGGIYLREPRLREILPVRKPF